MGQRSCPNETGQGPVVLAPSMSSACLLPVENFGQRISLIREMRTCKIVRVGQIIMMYLLRTVKGFPGGTSGKEPAWKCRRHNRCEFNPLVGKILWRRKWPSTPVFLPGESPWTEEPGGLQSMGSQRVGQDWVTKHRNITERIKVMRTLGEGRWLCFAECYSQTI